MEFELTANQKKIFEAVETEHNNFLICGKPGVGKSVLINALVERGNKSYTLAAPTGLAALNIGGKTLHSLFGLPVSQGIIQPTYNNYSKNDRVLSFIKYRLKYLIVDEISMVRADMFDFIDRLLRNVKGYDVPFGGVQIIIVGDFYQLPPVVVGNEKTQLREAGYSSEFVFSSKAFHSGRFITLQLNEVLRQKGDPKFINILDSARVGNMTGKHLRELNNRVEVPTDLRIKLTGTNKQAEQINQFELNKIDMPVVTFHAEKFGEWPAYPTEEELKLKVGAHVMVKKNAADRPPEYSGEWDSDIVNGTIGKVVEIIEAHQDENEEGELTTYPAKVTIELDNGHTATIYSKRWERKIKKQEGENWQDVVVASFEQIPLALAWAISIHKSQGQSFDKVHIDASSIFAPGQLYVALSRCRTLAGISFESELTVRKFFANINVVEFYNEMWEA